MNILFDASKCGLANNGGSKTIIRSAETLKSLGHGVKIFSPINKYSLHDYDKELIVKNSIGLRECHIVLVSVWELEECYGDPTIRTEFYNLPVWWCRGWEKWVYGEEKLIELSKRFVAAGGKIIVNSSWLIDQFKEKCNIDVELCFAGMDFDKFYPPIKQGNKIGILYHKKHKTKNNFFEEIKAEYGNRLKILYSDANLGYDELREFYSDCSIWIANSSLEGFHNVPAEAALCGCGIASYDSTSGGTCDYNCDYLCRFSKMSTLRAIVGNYEMYCDNNKYVMHDLFENIGSREKNMKRFVKLLSDYK